MGWFEAGARAGRGRLAARWWTRAACSSRGPPQADHAERSEGSHMSCCFPKSLSYSTRRRRT